MRKTLLATLFAASVFGTATAQTPASEPKRIVVTTDSLLLPDPPTINELRRERGLTDVNNLFVPKGQWIFGGTASYSTHTNEGYQFLVVECIRS